MLRGILLLTLCLLGVYAADLASENQPELTIKADGDYVKGTEIVITCEAPIKNMIDVLRITRIITDPTLNKNRAFEVVQNSYLEDTFKNTGRYSVDFSSADGRMRIDLKITELMGADEGDFACQYVTIVDNKDQSFEAAEAILVKVPPSKVSLSSIIAGSIAEVESGETVVFSDKQESGFICKVEVEDGDIAPDVKITIGDKDITEQFTKTEEKVKTISSGLWERSYNAEYQWKSGAPDKSHNGEMLKCEASVPGIPEALSSELKVEVQFAPHIECREEFYQKLAQKDAKMLCTATMYPAPTGSHWSWSTGEGDAATDVQVVDGASSEDMVVTASFKEVDGEKDKYEFALTFTELAKAHFKDYKLSVTNAVGTSEASIKLEEEEEMETPAPVQEKSESSDNGKTTESTQVEGGKVDEIVDKEVEAGGEAAWNASGATSIAASILLFATTLLFAL